jgi:hypothetical protein
MHINFKKIEILFFINPGMKRNGLIIDKKGNKTWYLNNKIHRLNGPAVERANGDREWYRMGRLHRVDDPAIERANGDREWYVNGLCHRRAGTRLERVNGRFHRSNGPAVVYASGSTKWAVNGRLHRTDGPAVEWADGDKFWLMNGKIHRVNGPACETAYGDNEWYSNDRLHRAGGPAVTYVRDSYMLRRRRQVYPDIPLDKEKYEWWYKGVEETREANTARERPHRERALSSMRQWLPIETSGASRFPLVSLIIDQL